MIPTSVATAMILMGGMIFGPPPRDLRRDLKAFNVRLTTEHYAIAGTVSDAKLGRYGRALEFIYQEYVRGFSELIQEPAPRDDGKSAKAPFTVVVLATAPEYEEFTRAYFGANVEHTNGLFVPAVDMLIIRDESDFEDTCGILFHEAFHQFARRHVSAMPVWLNEGMATYFGTARATEQGLAFDHPKRESAAIVLDAAKKKELVSLRRLMDLSQTAFYDQSPVENLAITHRTLCYAQSYTLASYMINDVAGRKHLRAYMRELSGVTSFDEARQVTHEMFDQDLLDAMVEPWLSHTVRLSSR